MRDFTELETTPAYGQREAAQYLRLDPKKTGRWAKALCTLEEGRSFPLSFVNLLELHVLKAMRITHRVPMQRIRRAMEQLRKRYETEYPLLRQEFLTDGLDLLVREENSIINLSRFSQHTIQEIVQLYTTRIEIEPKLAKLFPFIADATPSEAKSVVISPSLSFGRPVVAGTSISTEVIAGRFFARESMSDLADEYQLPIELIEEVIRWEMNTADAA